MSEFKKGDVVVMASGHVSYFHIGDVGIIRRKGTYNGWWIDFSQNDRVYGNGEWYAKENHFMKIDPQPKKEKMYCEYCGKKLDN